MSKAVLISIQPKWCEKIASGEKTIEVRKTKPKLETPFKCYIYCTKEKYKVDALHVFPNGRIEGWQLETANIFGEYCNERVIGEFICDNIDEYLCKDYDWGDDVSLEYHISSKEGRKTCLEYDEIKEYGNEKPIYFWHISNLKIYDKPKELSEFITPCKMGDYPCCGICDYAVHGMDGDLIDCDTSLTRPPQSWCYVEELQNG